MKIYKIDYFMPSDELLNTFEILFELVALILLLCIKHPKRIAMRVFAVYEPKR